MSWWSRFVNVMRADRVTRDIEEEQQFHIEARADDLVAHGMTREAATAQAEQKFGRRLLMREASRDVKLLNWLESLWRDMRLGLRLLRKDAIVSAAAIVSLGLAIGAVTSAFALIDALILRDLPVRDPASLVVLERDNPASDPRFRATLSYPLFERIRETASASARMDVFSVSFQSLRQAILPDGGGIEEKVGTQFVSGNAFDVLGVKPAIGRLLTPSDDHTIGAHQTAVISHAFWTRRLGADPRVIGQWMHVDQRAYQIVGVAQEGFTGVHPGVLTDVWLPNMMFQADSLNTPHWNWLQVWGRLKPGVTREAVQPIVQASFINFAIEHATSGPGGKKGKQQAAELAVALRDASAGHSEVRRMFQRPLIALAMIAACVLLIACSNVANLLLARGAARAREMALRASIGAGRGRLLQQVLVESSVLTAAAIALGVIAAAAATPLIVGLITTADKPVYVDASLDWRVLMFVATLGCLTTLLFGLVPAMRAAGVGPGAGHGARHDARPDDASRSSSRGARGGASASALATALAGGRTHTATAGVARPLVALQIGFSVMILFVAALLMRSFDRLLHVDLGFDPHHVTLLSIESREKLAPDRTRAIGHHLLDRVRALSGVDRASLSNWALFKGWSSGNNVVIPGRGGAASFRLEVSPGFFTTMGARIIDGRELAAHEDDATRPRPVVVNAVFARKYFPGERAVGRRMITTVPGETIPIDIVGVVDNLRDGSVRGDVEPYMFAPIGWAEGTIQIRSPLDPRTLADRVRDELPRVHPALRLVDVTRQTTLVNNTLLRERLLAVLSGFFAALGLALAAVGLYGVSSYAVVRRTREIGIRLTLGARPAAVVRSVLGRLALAVIAGIVAGLAGGVYFASFVRALLFETEPISVWGFGLPVLCLLGVALAAAWPPARRATRIDPAEALRLE
jgi:MacB-like periplasmic core domain/FtsX-like permease family